jgi:hypothetical protein
VKEPSKGGIGFAKFSEFDGDRPAAVVEASGIAEAAE